MYFIHRVIGLELAYWIVPVFGALGGLVGSMIRNSSHLVLVAYESASRRVRLGFIGDIILGLGGSAVVAFLFENTLNFDPGKTSSYPLMISVCFTAGVFGQLLIEMAGEKVIAKEALKVAKSAQKDTESLKITASAAFVSASYYEADKGSLDKALQAADEALELDPSNVAASIAKARALKRMTKVNEALEIINAALKRPDLAGTSDLGVLLYNKACYKLLIAPEAVDEALELLRRSFELYPHLKTIAPKDGDLTVLLQNPEFMRLTG
jgi:uncharacterized membrane protein YeaQ/YmgE (transglycosylase-associated protein family)